MLHLADLFPFASWSFREHRDHITAGGTGSSLSQLAAASRNAGHPAVPFSTARKGTTSMFTLTNRSATRATKGSASA